MHQILGNNKKKIEIKWVVEKKPIIYIICSYEMEWKNGGGGGLIDTTEILNNVLKKITYNLWNIYSVSFR